MKRFLIDFIIAFFIIVAVFGMSGSNSSSDNNINYEEEVIDNNEDIENIKDYDGNLINRVSFKINGLIQEVADFGFEIFKKALKTMLD